MKDKSLIIIIIGFILLLGSLLSFFNCKDPLELFISSAGVYFMLMGIFLKREYNWLFYLILLGLSISMGFILLYQYVVIATPISQTFYFYLGIFILFTMYSIYMIVHEQPNEHSN